MPQKIRPTSKIRGILPLLGIALVVMITISSIGVFFFVRGRGVMEWQLKDKLTSTAGAAAMQFSGEQVARIKTGDEMTSSADLKAVVTKLQRLREEVSNIRYVYIMRRTDNPKLLEFVADADLALTDQQLDRNKNGVVDSDEEASVPGDTYDWTDFPILGKDAFLRPAVDPTVGSDQWGPIISGYAPIRDSKDNVVAVLGIDMAADEYAALSTSIFSPVALLLLILASMCLAGSIMAILWRRRIETLEHIEMERSGLLRLAFHQLGGPLTIISWSLEELEEEGPASIQRTIANIQEGVHRLTDILRTLKSADLVHTGKLEYNPEFASLTSILERVTKEMGVKLGAKKQHVVMDLEENITMKIDTKLIAGVAQELLTNASDFSPQGAVITLRSRKVGKYAEFSVVDTGCGIPKQDIKRIFGEFARASNATKYKADGNGLGLYIVRGIIEQASGKVSMESEEGKGTTITIKLPIA